MSFTGSFLRFVPFKIVVFIWLLSGCASFNSESSVSEDEKKQSKQEVVKDLGQSQNKKPRLSMSQFELKLAKLWSKVEEQEIRLAKQSEKLKLLEKGLMLGVIPKQILDEYDYPDQAMPLIEKSDEHAFPVEGKIAEEGKDDKSKFDKKLVEDEKKSSSNEDKSISEDVNVDESAYTELLKQAQEKFNQGSYGQAIAHYQQLHELFPKLTDKGQHHFWIGLSWYYLKEDPMASQSFEALLKEYPKSPFIGRANLYMARIDARSGLRKTALDRLRRIIQSFPNDEIGEMARFELERLKDDI